MAGHHRLVTADQRQLALDVAQMLVHAYLRSCCPVAAHVSLSQVSITLR
jgi:hypothetical protein